MSNDFPPTARLLSVRDAGWIEVGDARVFLLDALGGFYAMREEMVREVGVESEAEILYRAGFAGTERLLEYSIANGFLDPSEGSLSRALGLLTTGGYGQFVLEEARLADGWAVIVVRNSLEGWMYRRRQGRSGYVCNYLRGMLRGIMQHLVTAGGYTLDTIECAEIECLANNDHECRFVIGTTSDLRAKGYRISETGQNSVRETLLRLNRQLEEVLDAAQKDFLTDLYNRAHLESTLARRLPEANRRSGTLSLAMIDIDGFKAVNDTRGHGMGDLALRQIARLLSSQARDTDTVARYGGDEFAWLMPNTPLDAAVAVADRIRSLVQESQENTDLPMPLTLSIGIAACPEDAATMEALIDLADQAMYRAKDAGGNQVQRYLPVRHTRPAAPRPPEAVPEPVSLELPPVSASAEPEEVRPPATSPEITAPASEESPAETEEREEIAYQPPPHKRRPEIVPAKRRRRNPPS